MSIRNITKEVEAIVCDFCDLEVDKNEKDYCYHYIKTDRDDEPFNGVKYKVKHYLFYWSRPKPDTGFRTKMATTEYVRYDFHTACFDKLVQKFLTDKKWKVRA